jgi:hypothetical protein
MLMAGKITEVPCLDDMPFATNLSKYRIMKGFRRQSVGRVCYQGVERMKQIIKRMRKTICSSKVKMRHKEDFYDL